MSQGLRHKPDHLGGLGSEAARFQPLCSVETGETASAARRSMASFGWQQQTRDGLSRS